MSDLEDQIKSKWGVGGGGEGVLVCGHCLVTLSLTKNETLKRLRSLPI